MRRLLKPSLDWLLVLVPLSVFLEYVFHASATWIFLVSAAAVIPLAKWLGTATEHLARNTSESIGGLLNATFGNAAELIIALLALRAGLRDVVKASLTGSIIGNCLLVLGAAALAGGLRYPSQRFNETAARVQATALTLAAIALIIPAAYHHLVRGSGAQGLEDNLSLEISIVLLITYALGLLFSLHTHRQLFAGKSREDGDEPGWSTRRGLAVLAITTAAVGWISEILVGSVEEAARSLGMTSIFVGVIVVGIIGNAAEHSTAVLVARRNKMDLAVGIAVGSTMQVALFVAPILVIASHFIGPQPMDLVFSTPEILAIGLSIWIAGQISGDGETNWLEGVQLLAVYVVLAMTFYVLPASGGAPAR